MGLESQGITPHDALIPPGYWTVKVWGNIIGFVGLGLGCGLGDGEV